MDEKTTMTTKKLRNDQLKIQFWNKSVKFIEKNIKKS